MAEAAVVPPPVASAPAPPAAPPADAPNPALAPRDLSPAKPGSAKERMQKDLLAKANKTAEPEPPKTPEPPKVDLEAEPPPNTPEDKKAKPWRIVDQYKKRNSQLEKELADARANALPEAEVKTLRERAEAAQKK